MEATTAARANFFTAVLPAAAARQQLLRVSDRRNY
jgi:hypothetical protein